jgi:short-subunit dehydrogenase
MERAIRRSDQPPPTRDPWLEQRSLGERRRGGNILAGAMGAENGVPCMANDGAAKAYVHSLGEALHYEFKPLGVYVTVLAAGFGWSK